VPSDWQAVANAPEAERKTSDGRSRVRFAATEPLPTYLYAFAAGRLLREEATLDGRELCLMHRCADRALLMQNLNEVFRLHAEALRFLEDYTGIADPFARFACVLIPDFEFAGMEHPGCIFYRENLIFLDATATERDQLRRANLITHESAHLWFGDLVTMRWFDDVWLKEVFANFMADKFLAEQFPDVEHELGFLLRHYPPAYAIDRTEGTHAIRRSLDNLSHAAELYDALIYHKAPIAMARLEAEIGAAAMRAGLRAYLAEFRFANADWPELRTRLERAAGRDLADWSRGWIESRGRPRLGTSSTPRRLPEYGQRELGEAKAAHLLLKLESSPHALERATAWLEAYEAMLDGDIGPRRLLTSAVIRLESEPNDLLISRLLEDLANVFWRCLHASARGFAAGPVERVLLLRRNQAVDSVSANRWIAALARFASTAETASELEALWRGERAGSGRLPESLALRLAIRLALLAPDRAAEIVDRQLHATEDASRRGQLEFIAPALGADAATRNALRTRLVAGEGRGVWQVTALRLLNHPLQGDATLDFLEPGIAHAAALRERGDIFLPRQWLDALFFGHGTAEAAARIRVAADAGHAPRFRSLLLETADPVFRAAAIRERSAYP
jgi:aminopeptidase N